MMVPVNGGGLAMPHSEPIDLRELVGDRADGEYTLDLRGVTAEHARIAIERMLERRRFGSPTTVNIRLDPATPTSGETLFLPVGRQLLEARRRGLVARLSPLPEADGGGFFVQLPGHPSHAVDPA